MLTPSQQLAVARLEAGAQQGTCFLVGERRVLTAWHVARGVAHLQAIFPAAPAAPIAVTSVLAHGTGEEGQGEDWALLELAAAPTADPLPLTPLAPGHLLAWDTAGFPAVKNGASETFTGEVLDVRPHELKLRSDEVQGTRFTIEGTSGAPVVVGGGVVGIVERTAPGQDAGVVYAVPILRVAARAGLPLVFAPPFLADVAAWLKKADVLALRAAATKALGMTDPGVLAPEALAIHMARAMLSSLELAWEVLSALVEHLDREPAMRICERAGAAFVHEGTVDSLRAWAARPDRKLAWLSASGDAARAYHLRTDPRWVRRELLNRAGADPAGDLRAQIEERLVEYFNLGDGDLDAWRARDPGERAKDLHDELALQPESTRLLFVFPGKPSPQIAPALLGWRALAVWCCAGARWDNAPALAPWVDPIEPELDPDTERAALSSFRRAKNRLEQAYKDKP